MEDIFTACDWCEQPILYGNASVTIERKIEKVDLEQGELVATVIHSDVALTLCPKCGDKLQADELRRMLSRSAH